MEAKGAVFEAHMRDLARSAQRGRARFSSFLGCERQAQAENILKRAGCPVLLHGGFDMAERRVLGVFPPGEAPSPALFPITCLTARIPKGFTLTHRDFLGALTAAGIKREVVGDILIEEENAKAPARAFFFVLTPAAGLLRREVSRVGRAGVALAEVSPGDDASHGEGSSPWETGIAPRFEETSCSVASPRLDCVVSALARVPRREAVRLIESGLVALGGAPCGKAAKNAAGGDRLSIRGKGKFLLVSMQGTTRKGRIILHAKRYL